MGEGGEGGGGWGREGKEGEGREGRGRSEGCAGGGLRKGRNQSSANDEIVLNESLDYRKALSLPRAFCKSKGTKPKEEAGEEETPPSAL